MSLNTSWNEVCTHCSFLRSRLPCTTSSSSNYRLYRLLYTYMRVGFAPLDVQIRYKELV